MDLSLDTPELPDGLYRNDSHQYGVRTALAHFNPGLEKPAIYYPGSSTDISLAAIPNATVLGVDLSLTLEQIATMAKFGMNALAVDLNKYEPLAELLGKDHADLVLFLNPTGIPIKTVLERTPLRTGSLVIYRSWTGAPSQMAPDNIDTNYPRLEYAGAIVPLDDSGRRHDIDLRTHSEMYTQIPFDELDERERAKFEQHLATIKSIAQHPDGMSDKDLLRAAYDIVGKSKEWQTYLNYRPFLHADGKYLVFRVK